MFKFNFQLDKNDEGIFKNDVEEGNAPDSEENLECYECEHISIKEDHIKNVEMYEANCLCDVYGSTEVKYLMGEALKKIIKKSIDIKRADEKYSDLLPGIYEGGAKIWECTTDLLKYFSTSLTRSDFMDKRVLDLGCGAGLLGVFALRNGSYVEFQDYNKDVIETITIPNVMLNIPKSNDSLNNNLERITLYSGDWSKYSEKTNLHSKFDLILTSETIYNMKNYDKLLNTFKNKLKNDGRILLAAKIYYFGVGGGVRQFEEQLKSDGVFVSKSIWQSNVNVPREILEIKYKDEL